MKKFDSRVTPARADLAAAELRGVVDAPRFATGRVLTVTRGIADLRVRPDARAQLETQVLYGEIFIAYDEDNGWAWGQAATDNYVGYVRADCLTLGATEATHRVTAISTPLLAGADPSAPTLDLLPLNARVVANDSARFVNAGAGFVFAGHLAPLAETAPDWVAVAERFVDVPYVWGGKAIAGIDCSGLLQTSLQAAGKNAPRDTDMMEAALGSEIAKGETLRRGDLVFWRRHVGVMRDAETLLHANAFFMAVTSEPLTVATDRIARTDGPVRMVKRL